MQLMQQRDPCSYFIKKRFAPANKKKGLFLQISKQDIKHYLNEHTAANPHAQLIEKLEAKEFLNIVDKFFFQSKSTLTQ